MKKVIVIGGGFAGSLAAKKLEKDFQVTLIDTKDYFEFTPGILRTILKPHKIKKIEVLHTSYLDNAKVVVGEVKEVAKDHIKINGKKIRFNYLVICAGSSYHVPFKEQRVVSTARARNLWNHNEELCKAKKVLIIGGGLVAVELAGELLWKFSNSKEITLVHAHDSLIERNPKRVIKYVERFLKKKGVKIVYSQRVIKENGKTFITDKGTKIKADIAFLCTGITPNFDLMKKNFSDKLSETHQIKVNEYLQLQGTSNIFVAGDINDISQEKTAQNAQGQAEVVVKNIRALDKGRKLQKYHARRTPLVISLGKYMGIYSGKNIFFTGVIPGFMKYAIEKWEMFKKGVI